MLQNQNLTIILGQSFGLAGVSGEYGAATSGPGKEGQWTQQRGMLAFYEICSKGIGCLELFKRC